MLFHKLSVAHYRQCTEITILRALKTTITWWVSMCAVKNSVSIGTIALQAHNDVYETTWLPGVRWLLRDSSPKTKILSSFNHSQVVPNLYACLYSAEHKRKIFWRMWETNQFWGIVFLFPTMEVNGAPKHAWLQTFFKISSFVFDRKN